MPSKAGNFVTTSLLTLFCSAVLFFLYRRAVAPMLKHYNIVPLRDFSSAISNRYNSNRYRRLGEENQYLDEPEEEEDVEGDGNRENRRERRLSRDLEEGFKDDSDDEGGDDRLRISRDTTRDESRVEG